MEKCLNIAYDARLKEQDEYSEIQIKRCLTAIHNCCQAL